MRERNRRAFGFDMYSEPIRRKAMARARDSAKPALSGMVKLVQETNVEVQNGFLLYLPLYKKEASLQTAQERRAALTGFVFAPFRVNDLMKGIFRNRFTDLGIEIYDGPTISEDALLYASDTVFHHEIEYDDALFMIRPVHVASYTWQLYIRALPGFGYETAFPWFILGGGIIISGLIFLIMSSLTNIKRSTYLRQLITDNATAALFIVDNNDYCTFSNPAAEELTGFSAQELKKQTLHSAVHHSYPSGKPYPASDCPIVKILRKNGAIYNHESTFFHKNGHQIQVNINAQPIYENGRPVAHLLEVRDITQEKLSENALREKNKNLQTLNSVGKNLAAELELNKLLQVITDSCTELTGAEFGAFFYNKKNEKGEALLLYTLSGAEMKDFENFPLPRATHLFSPTFNGEGVVRSDDITKDERYGKNAPYHGMPEGHLPVKSYLAVPVISRSGTVLGGLFFGHAKAGVFTDSAEEIVKGIAAQAAIAIDNSSLFEDLNLKNDELLKINNDLDNFVYTASHDLKAPMLNIEGLVYALTAALNRNKPERIQEIIEKMQLSVHKFKETIQALTEVAKINKNVDEELEVFDLRALLDDVLFSINDMLQDSNAILNVAVDCPDVRFSKANMRSIFLNLITNAIKYRSDERKLLINISCYKEAGEVVIKIQDNGLGISSTHINKIFTMFKRYHTHVEGTGIGLYLVKRIVENYGGNIKVESEVDKGTTFTISLPEL